MRKDKLWEICAQIYYGEKMAEDSFQLHVHHVIQKVPRLISCSHGKGCVTWGSIWKEHTPSLQLCFKSALNTVQQLRSCSTELSRILNYFTVIHCCYYFTVHIHILLLVSTRWRPPFQQDVNPIYTHIFAIKCLHHADNIYICIYYI